MADILPNQYHLHHPRVRIAYSTGAAAEERHFRYDDGRQVLDFYGLQVRVAEAEIGQVVSVTIYRVLDTESVSFSVVIPLILLPGAQAQASVHTYGVWTTHRSPLMAPPTGQRETSLVEKLEGTARAVVSLAKFPVAS
jgi:hypothetical protein